MAKKKQPGVTLYGPDNRPITANARNRWSKISRLAKRQPSESAGTKPKKRSLLWTTIGVLVTLISGVSGALVLLPRVAVQVSDPVDSNDPFSASATITNAGYIPLDSVKTDIAIEQIIFVNQYGRRISLIGDMQTQRMHPVRWIPQDLGLDSGYTVALNDSFSSNRRSFVSGEMAIVVEYEIPLLHLHREKRFPFITKHQSNGYFYWYRETMPKP